MGTLLFISSQQGGFTPVNFASTSSESGNITNLCSNKSHLKKKWLKTDFGRGKCLTETA